MRSGNRGSGSYNLRAGPQDSFYTAAALPPRASLSPARINSDTAALRDGRATMGLDITLYLQV